MQRHRVLPSWMAKKQEKEKESLTRRRKRKVARAVFYCMNEKELVEAAVSCLSNSGCEDVTVHTDHKVGNMAGDATVEHTSSNTNTKPVMEVLEEESSDCHDALESTYVSETDLDITEVETLPYSKSPQHQAPEGQRSEPVEDHSGVTDVELEAEKTEERPKMKGDSAEEEDALRLVREIFFS
ncbi:uncharacterized protein si:ch211-127m7.2 [Anabas testudineus]|uniref:uncharacterized protein si:ch211-127m7.2 n=1 Tax=Anabas testudineus TaxID=64144 RepID=UPI00143D1317|nr:uncharacterized protein si:ch211-127m7.2 [Anabas testudineus]